MTTPFVPDTLLPGQLESDLPGGRAQQGERLLLLAVLQDAVDTYRRCRGSRDPEARLLFDETRAWVESRDHDTVFSFESLCDALDIDPDYLRRRLSEGSVGVDAQR
jgi:hypothetical protein